MPAARFGMTLHAMRCGPNRYALDDEHAPAITAINGEEDATAITTATYGDTLTITWGPKVEGSTAIKNVTSVALVAPSAVTHGFNNNQRLVWLPVTRSTVRGSTGTLDVRLPPSATLAPPQMYLLFLNNVKTYSRAWWVHLQDSGEPAATALGL
jgi:hypothetical protein